jgi:hypothetical protein
MSELDPEKWALTVAAVGAGAVCVHADCALLFILIMSLTSNDVVAVI